MSMYGFILFLYTAFCGYRFPQDYKALCYKILGTDKHLQIYQLNMLRFEYDWMMIKISQGEASKDVQNPVDTTKIYYLDKVSGHCRHENLQFKKIGKEEENRAFIDIELLNWGTSPFQIDRFQLYLLHDHQYGTTYLEGMRNYFVLNVDIVQHPACFKYAIKPEREVKKMPDLLRKQYYCLNAFKYGTTILDLMNLPWRTTRLEPYFEIKIVLMVKNGDTYVVKETYIELAQYILCTFRRPSAFTIYVQKRQEDQQVDFELLNPDEKNLKVSYRVSPTSGFSIYKDDTTNYKPRDFKIISESAAKAITGDPKVTYILFENTPRFTNCTAYDVNSYFKESVAENVVIKTESYGFLLLPQTKGVLAGRVMDKDQIDKCKAAQQ